MQEIKKYHARANKKSLEVRKLFARKSNKSRSPSDMIGCKNQVGLHQYDKQEVVNNNEQTA